MCFGRMVVEGKSMHMAICYDLVYLIDLQEDHFKRGRVVKRSPSNNEIFSRD